QTVPQRAARHVNTETEAFDRPVQGILRSPGCSAPPVSGDHLPSGERVPSSTALIQPVPASLSTCTQLPERSSSLTVASLGAVPITRPFLPGADRMLAGPRMT